MLDLTTLTDREIDNLEFLIQEHKKNNFKAYKVTFYVKFKPHNHVDDALTYEGTPDTTIFSDYLDDNIINTIENDFNMKNFHGEYVSSFIVEEMSKKEVMSFPSK
jgi:hypothetical protein